MKGERGCNLQVLNIQNSLLVDSRDVAVELGIEHSDWMQNTVKKHQDDIEQAFGVLRFENGKVKAMGRPVKYALLTEDQATFLMTLSTNTPQVIRAKVNLVKAFSEAKRLLAETEHADKVSDLDWRQGRTNGKSVHVMFRNACLCWFDTSPR